MTDSAAPSGPGRPPQAPANGPTAAPPPSSRARASATVASGILLSRISGLVRERALAYFFGVSMVADAWRAALKAPNVLQNLLGEGTLSASFIPIYSELIEESRDEEAARFAGAIVGLLTVIATLVALAGIALAPLIVSVLFPGFDPARQALTTSLVRILFPMTAVLVVSAWALGVLNSHRKFFLPYVAPVVWNGAMVVALIFGSLGRGLTGEDLARFLAWGALVGGGLQLLVQLPTALRLLGEFRPSLSLDEFGVREALRNFIPVFWARGAVNLSGFLDYFLASFLAVGATAVLGYAQTLYLLPISLFGLSVAASELPELSRGRRAGTDVLARDVSRAMARMAFFLVPSTVGYLVLGDVVVAALFETGSFGGDEVLVTWCVLGAYALGMSASAMSRALSSSFYALRDTRTPARIAYLRVGLSLVVGLALMFPLDRVAVGDLRLGAAGLALGAVVGAWTEWGLLARSLRRTIGPFGLPGGYLIRLAASAVLAGGISYGMSLLVDGLHPWIEAIGTLVPFAGVYLLAAKLLTGSPEPGG